MNPVNTYLAEVARYFADPNSSEHSYRTSFQNYLATIFPESGGYFIQQDQRAINGNKPDYIVLKNRVPLLYIEVKKVGEDLDKIEKSNQADRYFGYTNLIISDYVEFRFFRNGQKYSDDSITLGDIHTKQRVITPHPENADRLARTLTDFIASQKEPIKNGKHLAQIMGGKARRVRDNVVAFLETEGTDKDELIRMRTFIKEHLIANFSDEDFADMYAQTLVYGLFAARYNDDTLESFTRQEARDLVPITNPFLKSFFDHISGTSFPRRLELIVNELCEVFSHANVKDLMEDYFKQLTLDGGEKESPDPVIHFYEDFLREYDSSKKMEMGVFYTPLPVVRFIVRGIDELLKKEFGIEKGLADNEKIDVTKYTKDDKGKDIKEVKQLHRVQLLDVAVGTGTFLNETVNFIYETQKSNQGRWTAYVNDDLLPRLHGFELMMASYTIAHLKLAMTLKKSGVSKLTKRLGVYLSNTLDDAHTLPLTSSLFGVVNSIAQESRLASEVKNDTPIMVVMGNPPYSGISQNKHYTGNSVYKVEPGGLSKLNERKHWLDDDYVKFIRFAESMVEKNGEGIIAMITAHGYIDNPTFRGMRWKLRDTFDVIYVLDLHGNSNKKETAPDGSEDKNVFDIKTGVSIIFGVKKKSDTKKKGPATVFQADLYGKRALKFDALVKGSIENIKWNKLPVVSDIWKIEGEGKVEYQRGFSVAELFPKNTTGIVTAIDRLSIFETEKELIDTTEKILNSPNPYSEFGIKDQRKSTKEQRIAELRSAAEKNPTKISYRPFDTRYMFYTEKTECWINSPRFNIMENLLKGNNISLLLTKAVNDPVFNHSFVTQHISEAIFLSGTTATNAINLPLYLYENGEKVPNLDRKIVKEIDSVVGTTAPEDILDYVYAVLHSPAYRAKYGEFLKTDFPRVPYSTDKEEFWKLVPLGTKLRNLHILTDPQVNRPITSFPVAGSDVVEKPIWKVGKVYINDEQYWDGVPEAVWNFYIGGYQPAQKYLKDRKGRTLTTLEFENYEKMIVSLNETIKVMLEIDKIIKI